MRWPGLGTGQLCDQGAQGREMMMVVTITIFSEHLVISLLSRYRHPPPHFSLLTLNFFVTQPSQHSQDENLSVKVLEPQKMFEMFTKRMLIEDIS